MNFREFLRSASLEILAHKARSALTCVSLCVGVAAMLFTFSQTSYARRWLSWSIRLMGPGRIEIHPKPDYIGRGLSPGLTFKDSVAIRSSFPEFYMVYPKTQVGNRRARIGNFHTKDLFVFATTPQWSRRDWLYALRGRFISDEDVRQSARVCVLFQPGGWLKKPVWAENNPEQELSVALKHQDMLGKQLLIEDHLFTVIGIIEAPPRDRDPRWFDNSDWNWVTGGVAIVPISTYQHYLSMEGPKGNTDRIYSIAVDAGSEDRVPAAMRRMEGLLLTRHRGEKDFEVEDIRRQVQGALKQAREATSIVLLIGVVAILAGGIGIMNVTLATVSSRIREIGIRRSLGAARSDIVLQFTTEAMLLGFLGAATGLPLGFAADYYLADDPTRYIAWPQPWHAAAAVLIAVGAGFAFSLYPAWRASSFDPVEALRYE